MKKRTPDTPPPLPEPVPTSVPSVSTGDGDDPEWDSIQDMLDEIAHQRVEFPTAHVPVTDGHKKAAYAVGPRTLPHAHPVATPQEAVVIRDAVAPTIVLPRGWGKVRARWRTIVLCVASSVCVACAMFLVWKALQDKDGANRTAGASATNTSTVSMGVASVAAAPPTIRTDSGAAPAVAAAAPSSAMPAAPSAPSAAFPAASVSAPVGSVTPSAKTGAAPLTDGPRAKSGHAPRSAPPAASGAQTTEQHSPAAPAGQQPDDFADKRRF